MVNFSTTTEWVAAKMKQAGFEPQRFPAPSFYRSSLTQQLLVDLTGPSVLEFEKYNVPVFVFSLLFSIG